MPDRLTLKPSRQPAPAVQPAERPTQPPGQRQPQELQSAFLDSILDQPVTVFLINGIRLTGTVRQHDAFTVLLQDADGIDSLSSTRSARSSPARLPPHGSAGPRSGKGPSGAGESRRRVL